MPMLFSPTIGAAITAWLPVPLGALSGLPHNAIGGPANARSTPRRGRDQSHSFPICRSCRPNAPFAELLCLSQASVADEIYLERSRRTRGDI